MSTMQGEVLRAFRKLNIPEADAIEAAEALSRRDVDVTALKADMPVVKALLGVNTALLLALFAKEFLH